MLTGDLNAKDCDELAGIARTLVRLLSSPTHPLLWSIMDVPTGPTSFTEERVRLRPSTSTGRARRAPHATSRRVRSRRALAAPSPCARQARRVSVPACRATVRLPRHRPQEMRIDYILYQSDRIALTGVSSTSHLISAIPDATHPSDHLPVSARLLLKSKWAQTEDNARQWLACISGTTSCRPLSGDALRLAYEFFDKGGRRAARAASR